MVLRYIFSEEKKHTHNEAAKKYDVPVKTIEKWVGLYHQGKISTDHCEPTGQLSRTTLLDKITKLETENAILKKTIYLLSRKG